MGENCGPSNCGGGKCAPEAKCACGGSHQKDEHAEMIMQMADHAWAHLMKEKMMKEFEKAVGTKMNAVAAVAVEGSIAYWTAKMQGQAGCMAHTEKLKQAFMGK